jgi:hypothetical protein
VEVKRREQGGCGGGGPQHHIPLVLLPGEKTTNGKKEGSMAKRYADLGWAGLRLLAERKREVGRRMGGRGMGQREGERTMG